MSAPSAPYMNAGAKLYPQLENGETFRLSDIVNIRNQLQSEVESRAETRRHYKTAYTTSLTVSTGMCVVGSVTTTGAIGTLATGWEWECRPCPWGL
jgi:hypothetical protein